MTEDNLAKFGLDDIDFNLNKSKDITVPDYTNFRNVLFQYSQEFNNSVINYRFNNTKKAYWKIAVADYMRIYYQLKEKKRLSKVTKKQLQYMNYFYTYPDKITLDILNKLNLLVLKIMNKYGVYDISKPEEMYR